MKTFLRALLPFWWQILILFAGIATQVWATLRLPAMMSDVVNQGIVGADQNFIMAEGVKMLGVTAIFGVGALVTSFFSARVGSGLARNIRKQIFEKVMSFSIAEISGFSTSSLITRTTNDVNQVQQVTSMVLAMSLRAPLMGVGAIIQAFDTAPDMSWIIIAAVVSLLVVIAVVFILAYPKFNILQKLVDKLALVTRENLTGLRVVRAFDNEAAEEKKFDRANRELNNVNLFVNRVMVVMMPIISLILNFTTLVVIWVGARYIDAGVVEIGNLMAFMQYAMQVMMSFMFLSMAFIFVPRGVVSWKRINQVLGTALSIVPPVKPQKPQSGMHGVVEFRGVSFRYADSEEPVLHDISFKTAAGQTTAFIGSTGSGKSTLINLIPRFYDATDGEVLVDGVNVRDYSSHDLMEKIGYVPQKGVLFSGTVASNISFGSEHELDQANIERAAKIAQAADFVKKLDGGYEARIAQGGSNVSGGQKQRLSIARAVAKTPEIYIFDDSFSALDFKTDLKLREALRPITREAAVLIVAQRVGTIKQADQIVVLDRGRVVGIGKHAELLRSNKIYREIAESQLSERELEQDLLKTAKASV